MISCGTSKDSGFLRMTFQSLNSFITGQCCSLGKRSVFLKAEGDATPAASVSSRPKDGRDAIGSAHEVLLCLFLSIHSMFFSGSQCRYRAPA